MRSRAARVTLSAAVWIAIVGAAAFLAYSEREIVALRASTRAFDLRAREATDALADLRVAQQAYLAAGQGAGFWMPKVAGVADMVAQTLAALRPLAASAASRPALDEAAANLAEFNTIDQRAREYIKSGQQLMAGDVIFGEGGQTAATAARQIESARLSEHRTYDAVEASRRKQEAAALIAAGVFAALSVALLLRTPRSDRPSNAGQPAAEISGSGGLLMLREPPRRERVAPAVLSARAVSPILKAAAQLCTELARVNSLEDLSGLIGQAAHMMDASGLIVWLGNTTGADLRPVMAHGYTPQALARMPTVARSADNAAAAAYRSGTLQIVLARPGSSAGAIVAPLLGPDGCIGALSAEIVGGGEGSDSVQALATIFAAQITSVLGVPTDAIEQRAAASS